MRVATQSVKLTPNEVQMAANHAVLRQADALRSNRHHSGIRTAPMTWDNQIEGACAELAYCKAYGLYWSGASELGAVDCGGVANVRWTRHSHGGLFVYERDRGVMVVMDGKAPYYRVVGWMDADDGKREIWRDPCGEYLVPRECLHSMEDLFR